MTADLTGLPGPGRPVPYSLTPKAEAELAGPGPVSPDAEVPAPAGEPERESAYVDYELTPYELGITDDPDASWPQPANGIRPSPEAVAAHFEFASVAEMETAAECARDADIDAEVEARLEREALEADGELEPEAGL